MSVIPPSRIGKVEFCEAHVTPWSANAVAIGTTAGAVTDLQTKTTAARNAFNAQQAAQNAARAATNDFNMAVDAMAIAAANIVRQIKTKAATAGNSVYSLAEIPVPAVPSPVPAPGAPFDFAVELNADGSVKLKWKCNNPAGSAGTIYQIWRRLGSGEFAYLGGTGTKDIVDNTLPAGSSQVTYQLQAVRSTAVGPWAQYNVNFGVSGAGETTTSVTEGVPAKIAA